MRITTQTLKVLGAFSSGIDEAAGSDIAQRTNLASGTLYPILLRLEKAGWLSSRWEDSDPVKLGRPRKHLYRITALGIGEKRAAFNEVRAIMSGLGGDRS